MQIVTNTWPKAVRLNQENRDKFIMTVVEDVLPVDKKPCENLFVDKWNTKIYDDIFGPLQEDMKALPNWMFVETNYIPVDMYAHTGKKKAYSQEGIINFPAPKGAIAVERCEHSWENHNDDVGLVPIPEGHPAIDDYKQMLQEEVDWGIKRDQLQEQLRTMVYECNTSHQLFRAWPTALKYAEACFPFVQPAEAKRGGATSVSAEELDIGVKLAKTTVTGIGNT